MLRQRFNQRLLVQQNVDRVLFGTCMNADRREKDCEKSQWNQTTNNKQRREVTMILHHIISTPCKPSYVVHVPI